MFPRKIFVIFFLILIIFFSNFLLFPKPLISPYLSIYRQNQTNPLFTPTPLPIITIGLVGDLGLGRFINANARELNNFGYSFEKISSWLLQNDFNLANLESPIVDNCPTVYHNTFKFCGDPSFLPYLKQNKFILNLANNHIFNYGQSGFSQTKSYLDQNNIISFYSHDPTNPYTSTTLDGISFGFLGFDFVTNTSVIASEAKQSQILDLISLYNPQVDYLIVSIHWGNEYITNPETWRIKLAHLMIDAGADIIHGHHPHVWQEYETYQGKPIFYSLGNFIFDQNWSKETSQTFIIRLTLNKNTIHSIDKFPIQIKFNSQPVITQ